jgi:dihydroorotase
MKKLAINLFDPKSRSYSAKNLHLDGRRFAGFSDTDDLPGQLYVSPGFIDAHAHVYPGATCLGIRADLIGLRTGVHLVIDAGSSGSATFDCFRDYVVPTYETDVKAYLNISRIGLVTKQPYTDLRNIDIGAAMRCFRENSSDLLLGIKVMSSGIIVEDSGIIPLQKAVEAADVLGCRIMAHLCEGPPSNEDAMALLRGGDIITHCFHGKPNVAASLNASNVPSIDSAFYTMPNIMWNEDGSPTKPLEAALSRGVLLDVGHGAASFDQFIASSAIRAGVREFAISTDAHVRNIDSIVGGLPQTMTKFLALGMTISEVTASVTTIPARQHGLDGWCDDLSKQATIFRLRTPREGDFPLIDSNHASISAREIVEPVAVLMDSAIEDIIPGWENG